jgi:hypothetical protein
MDHGYCLTAVNVPMKLSVPSVNVCVPTIVVPFSVPENRHVVGPDAEPILKLTRPDWETDAASISVKFAVSDSSCTLTAHEPLSVG